VKREAEAAVLLLVGLVVVRLVLEGGYLWYVKPGLFWPLLVSCAILVVVGGVTLWRPTGDAEDAPEHGVQVDGSDPHGHAHAGGPRVGWLMLLPVVVLATMAPSSLGAFAADRASSNQFAQPSFEEIYGALPEPVDGAVPLTLTSTILRAFHDDERSLEDVPLRLVGFVVPDEQPGMYRLTRFVVGCCAADGQPIQVLVEGAAPAPAADTWLEVVGRWDGRILERGSSRLPVIALDEQRTIDEPAQPYEY
jgi:uncharacterized repeat protein (TIGR03943 family)